MDRDFYEYKSNKMDLDTSMTWGFCSDDCFNKNEAPQYMYTTKSTLVYANFLDFYLKFLNTCNFGAFAAHLTRSYSAVWELVE